MLGKAPSCLLVYVDSDSVNTVETYVLNNTHAQDSIQRSRITMLYMIPMIISGIFLLAGIILMVVSFLIVRFSIAFLVQEV